MYSMNWLYEPSSGAKYMPLDENLGESSGSYVREIELVFDFNSFMILISFHLPVMSSFCPYR